MIHCVAYVEDITLFSTNSQDLHNLIAVYVAYSKVAIKIWDWNDKK